MSRRPIGILSFGVFVVIVAVLLLMNVAVPEIIGTWDIIPLLLAFYGVWVMAIAGIRVRNPEKYERGAFSTFAWGLLFIVVGGGWYFNNHGMPLVFTAVLILLVIGVLAIVVAFKTWSKRTKS